MRPGSPVQGLPAGFYGLSFLALIWLFALRLSFPKVPPLLSGLPFSQINQFSTKYVYQAVRIVYEVRTELFSTITQNASNNHWAGCCRTISERGSHTNLPCRNCTHPKGMAQFFTNYTHLCNSTQIKNQSMAAPQSPLQAPNH